MDKISIIIPCYNEEESLLCFYKELNKSISKIKNTEFEIIFINDGSKDSTLDIIKKLTKNDARIKYISLSRNFGQEKAIYSGLKYASGNYVSIMDSDLQDPPDLLIEMYRVLKKGKYELVIARRNRKGENLLISFFSIIYYKLLNKIAKMSIANGERNFRMFTSKVKDIVIDFNEFNRFLKGIFNYLGFDAYYISYDNVKRVNGKTKYGFFKLCRYAIDSLFSEVTFLMYLFPFLGLLLCIFCFFIIILKITELNSNLIIYTMLVLNFIELLALTTLGKYLTNTYIEAKNRPQFVIRETNIKTSKRNSDKVIYK